MVSDVKFTVLGKVETSNAKPSESQFLSFDVPDDVFPQQARIVESNALLFSLGQPLLVYGEVNALDSHEPCCRPAKESDRVTRRRKTQ